MAGPFARRSSARPAAPCSAPRSARRSAGSPARCSSASDIGLPLGAGRHAPRCCRPTSAPSPRGSTSPRRTCGSTSRCARPPTSGCSPTCRGSTPTWSPRSRTTAAAPPSTSTASRPRSREIDPTNPAALQEAMQRAVRAAEDARPAGGARPPRDHARPRRGLGRRGRHPGHRRTDADGGKLQEIVRRRRAAGGPAEDAFAALVGLELRPRRLRDAATLWGSLRSRKGAAARDAVWAHPDLLPTAADLDDPLGFGERPELATARAASTATSTPRWPSCSTRTPPRHEPTRRGAGRAGPPTTRS